jgi:hypothetical protein
MVFFIGPSTYFRERRTAEAKILAYGFENYGGGFIEHFKLSGHESLRTRRAFRKRYA